MSIDFKTAFDEEVEVEVHFKKGSAKKGSEDYGGVHLSMVVVILLVRIWVGRLSLHTECYPA